MKIPDEEIWEYAHRLRRNIKKPQELNAFAIILICCFVVYIAFDMFVD